MRDDERGNRRIVEGDDVNQRKRRRIGIACPVGQHRDQEVLVVR
jgi:hypothetical protein